MDVSRSLPLQGQTQSVEPSKLTQSHTSSLDSKVHLTAISQLLTTMNIRDQKMRESKHTIGQLAKTIQLFEVSKEKREAPVTEKSSSPQEEAMTKTADVRKTHLDTSPDSSTISSSSSIKAKPQETQETLMKEFEKLTTTLFQSDMKKEEFETDKDLKKLKEHFDLLSKNSELDPSLLLNIESQMRTFLKNSDFSEKYQDLYEKTLLPLVFPQLEKVVDRLFKNAKPLSRDDFSKVLELQSQINDITELCEASGNKSPEIEKLKDLNKQIKTKIKESNPIGEQAAFVGKSATSAIGAMKSLHAKKQSFISKNTDSAQEVSLLPDEGAVFKKGTQKARTEQRNIESLMNFLMPTGFINSFTVKKPSLSRYGIRTAPEPSRALPLEKLSVISKEGLTEKGLNALMSRLPIEDGQILKTIQEQTKYDETYVYFKSNTNEKIQKIQMKNLRKLIEGKGNHPWDSRTPISLFPDMKFSATLEQHQFKNTSFYQIFSKKPSETTLAKERDLIERQLIYVQFPTKERGKLQKPEQMTIKKLRSLYQQDKISPDTRIQIPDPKKIKYLTFQEHLERETSVFKTISKNEQIATTYITPLFDSPKTEELFKKCEKLEWQYKDDKDTLHKVSFLELLTLGATNQIQFRKINLDRLPTLGMTKEDFEQIWSCQFGLVTPELMKVDLTRSFATDLGEFEAQPFMENLVLLGSFIDDPTGSRKRDEILNKMTPRSESVAAMTLVTQLLDFHENNTGFQLTKNGQYELRVFDTDRSMAESNELQIKKVSLYKDGKPVSDKEDETEYLIPLRSSLLSSKWKDKPLRESTVQHLLKVSEKSAQVSDWVRKKDAPIYRRLSKETAESVEKKLTPLLEGYSLSSFRAKNPDFTFSDLQQDFVNDMSDKKFEENKSIWEEIEKDLLSKKSPLIKAGDLTIAPTDHTVDKEKVKKAIEMRAKIAQQLFPRMTIAQHQALTQRTDRINTYLTQQKELMTSTLKGRELLDKIQHFIDQNSSLFNANQKSLFLKEIETITETAPDFEDRIEELRKDICNETQPTYFNLAKTMYPLLANAYELNRLITKSSDIAGAWIGHYQTPLGDSIKLAKQSSDPIQQELAKALEEQIASEKKPHFFGAITRSIEASPEK